MSDFLQQNRLERLTEDPTLFNPRFSDSLTASLGIDLGAHHIAEEREDTFDAHYETHFDPEFGAFWARLRPDSPKHFTP